MPRNINVRTATWEFKCAIDRDSFTRYRCVVTQPYQYVARYIRGWIAQAGVSRQQVADELGLVQQALSRRLTEKTPFTIDEVARLVELLGIDHGVMVDEVDRMRRREATPTRKGEPDAPSAEARKKIHEPVLETDEATQLGRRQPQTAPGQRPSPARKGPAQSR